jgi:Ankyrin repeats (many copies)
MTQRWMVLIAVLGFMPMILALRPVDEALLIASSKGDLSLVQTLIEKQADVNAANKDGETPLYNCNRDGASKYRGAAVGQGRGREAGASGQR